ncbi:glycolate oxidase subunit GlcD, partial [Desulfovibrio sp. OttesenSCG-928-G15]|nr:glycolate oxidase subunit GlcD [Desulfovibrio sp. OttesenSCG-928-G15]
MAISSSLVQEFISIVGKDNVFTEEADRLSYSYDAAVLKPVVPALVVVPE